MRNGDAYLYQRSEEEQDLLEVLRKSGSLREEKEVWGEARKCSLSRVVVVPILSCIFGFPVLVLLVICGLRYRARRARTAAKKAHAVEPSIMELSSGPSILSGRCSNGKGPRPKKRKKKTLVRFKPMPEIDLDTVVEEKSEFDAEVTASDLLTTPEEFVVPEDNTPASFRAYRYMGVVREGCIIMTDCSEAAGADGRSEESLAAKDGGAGEGGAGEVVGSSGSSDSDTAACFSLSPKQVTKSPTAVHLALKKLDGVMKRRHSSPVKGGSAKVRRSHTMETEGKALKKISCDYIDRELMPDLSPRASTVKYRRPASFSSKRRGESLKVKTKSLSKSNPHVLALPDGQPGSHEAEWVSATRSVQSRLSRCDKKNAVNDANDAECLVTPAWGCAVTVHSDSGCDVESPKAWAVNSPRRPSCRGEGAPREACPAVALSSEDEVVKFTSHTNYALKYRQEDGQAPGACGRCADADDERSTLV
ncbi:hypothetical protein C7M84_018163, partial [Penaeus vannamei]